MLIIAALIVGAVVLVRVYGWSRSETAGSMATVSEHQGTFANSVIHFTYPEILGTRYISLIDWPPTARVVDGPFACAEAGTETAALGRTTREVVGGREYCVTAQSEGAAGSVYTQYTYAFEQDGKLVTLAFNLRFVQCGNYEKRERVACEAERKKFDVSTVVDEIVQTVQLPKK